MFGCRQKYYLLCEPQNKFVIFCFVAVFATSDNHFLPQKAGGILENEAHHVVEDTEGHETEYEVETNGVDALHPFVGEFATGDDFGEGDEDVSAVEHGDGEEVHEGQHEGDEGRELPERCPVPSGGEEATDRTKRTNALCAFETEDIAEVADVATEYVPSVADACGEARKEVVVDGFGGVGCRYVVLEYTEFALCGEREVERIEGGVALVLHDHLRFQYLRIYFSVGRNDLVLDDGKSFVDFVPSGEGVAVEAHDAVARTHTRSVGRAVVEDAIHERRNRQSHERRLFLEHLEKVDVAQGDFNGLAAAEYVDGLCLAQVAEHIGVVEVGVGLVVGTDDDVAVTETHFFGRGRKGETMRDVANGKALLTPCEHHHRIDEEGDEEVDQHTAHHHEETLPSGLVLKELVGGKRCFFFRYGFCVGAFVDHTRDVHVATEGQPSDGEVCAAPFAEGKGLTLFAFPEVEEKAETVDANTKEFGEEEVSAFVENHEERDTKNELKGFDEEDFHKSKESQLMFCVKGKPR